MYPRQSATTHTEQLGAEASVYDWARGQVHALNPTAAFVWSLCDGATSPDAIAAALRLETGTPEADALVVLTLTQLARARLLELPVESFGDRQATTRRWLIRRGLAAATLPAIYSIVAPSPIEAQSAGAGAPTLTSVTPNQGSLGATVAVTLTGTNFVIGATTVAVASGGVTAANVVVSSATSLTVDIVIGATAPTGAHAVTVSTLHGTSGAQTFTVNAPLPNPPTLTSVSPNQGTQGTTVAVTLTGTNFVVGATTVAVGGSGVTVTNIVVGSTTALTASFAIDPAAPGGARTVTVATTAGTSGPQIFTINVVSPSPPTLTSVTPNQGIVGTTVAVTLTGTNFVVGATTVNVSGGGVTVINVAVTNLAVSSGTSLTAGFVLDPAAATGPRSVTVTTAAGTSGAQTFTINPPPGPGAPTLTSVSPNQGLRGATVAVTLTGTNFVVGATTVNVSGGGATVTNVVVGSSTSLTANFVLDPAAVVGPRTVTVTTAGGTSGPQGFTVILPPPTLTSVSPNQGLRGTTVAVTLTGNNFVVGATTVAVAGGGVTVANVTVVSITSLTASFVLDLTAAGPRTATVTTAGGTSGGQTFTISLPPPGSTTFNYTGGPQTFTVPAGVVNITILATGASGGGGTGGAGGLGGRTTATVSVTPGASLAVLVGGQGLGTSGGFNGGGIGAGFAGWGGGASSVLNGATSLVVVGGGGGGGATSLAVIGGGGSGGAGGGLVAIPGGTQPSGGGGGGGGTQAAGGVGGTRGNSSGTDGAAGVSGTGGNGGANQTGDIGGGGGGGGYFGGGGAGGGNPGIAGGGGGGGGSSFTAPGATAVTHDQGVQGGNGRVTISW